MSLYIYAETAFHHEGNQEYLFKLINEAKKSGVNGVKFQVLINLDDFMSSLHSSYKEAKNWTLSLSQWKEVFEYTEKLELDIILMPLDIEAFELVSEFKIKYIEIHSVSFKDEKLLKKLEENSVPLIFGIGGRTLDEIDYIVNKYNNRKIILMSGFQSFPSELKDIKLERIKELDIRYPNCVIGYADHSSYDDEMTITSNEYAYILGARVFEKHIAVEEGKDRIDFQSAINSDKIKIIKNKLENLESLLNIDKSKIFKMTDKEVIYRNRQKVPVAKTDIQSGQIISKEMLELKMINIDNSIECTSNIINKKVNKLILKDQVIFKDDLV